MALNCLWKHKFNARTCRTWVYLMHHTRCLSSWNTPRWTAQTSLWNWRIHRVRWCGLWMTLERERMVSQQRLWVTTRFASQKQIPPQGLARTRWAYSSIDYLVPKSTYNHIRLQVFFCHQSLVLSVVVFFDFFSHYLFSFRWRNERCFVVVLPHNISVRFCHAWLIGIWWCKISLRDLRAWEPHDVQRIEGRVHAKAYRLISHRTPICCPARNFNFDLHSIRIA